LAERYSFPKSERIFLQKEIDALFSEGSSFSSYPLRVIYVEKQPASGSRAAVLISVPKKKIRKAVGRNRIKRLIRETYRLGKPSLLHSLEDKNKSLLIAFIYVGDGLTDYPTMEAAMAKALKTLTGKLQ
jgi:ribonuclease P protein component, eubacterial